jgi:hypothetical protein
VLGGLSMVQVIGPGHLVDCDESPRLRCQRCFGTIHVPGVLDIAGKYHRRSPRLNN